MRQAKDNMLVEHRREDLGSGVRGECVESTPHPRTAAARAPDSPVAPNSDLARVDAHCIAEHEYVELPELTDEMLARATVNRSSRTGPADADSGATGKGSRSVPVEPGGAVKVRMEPCSDLSDYATVPNLFETHIALEVRAAPGGYALSERGLTRAFVKDYDRIESPREWPKLFDLSNWACFCVFEGDTRIGGALAAFDTPGIDLLEGRTDLVVLWDLRVAPDARRRGIATRLFDAVETWARERGATELKVETQNTNPAACRFYAERRCVLAVVTPGAYAAFLDEAQLIWRKRIAS